jgi:hypothetical protein
MARKRALKDAAKDPLAPKEAAFTAPKPQTAKKPLNVGRLAITVGIAVVVGFVGGVAASRFVRLV